LSYIYLFSGAFAAGNAIITGYYIGEEDYEGAYRNTLRTTVITILVVTFATLVVNLLLPFIAGLLTDNEAIIKTMRQIFLFVILLEIGRSLNLVIIQSLRAAEDTTFPLVMAIISMLGIGITASYLLSNTLHMGLLGIYLGITCDEFFRGLTMLIRWFKKVWMNKSLVKES
jgi:Na+-driven multidrug efflux pump